MKKLTIFAALAMVACLSAFTFTGCGGSNTESTASDTSAQESKTEESSKTEEESSRAEESSKTEEASMVNGKYASIEAYLADPTIKSALDSMIASNDTLTIEVKAEGDSLVYEYKYTQTYEDIELMKQSLESSASSVESTMVGVANSLKTCVDVENPTVVMRYLNGDGALICEIEYGADAE